MYEHKNEEMCDL